LLLVFVAGAPTEALAPRCDASATAATLAECGGGGGGCSVESAALAGGEGRTGDGGRVSGGGGGGDVALAEGALAGDGEPLVHTPLVEHV
jgi:hypothetical protein